MTARAIALGALGLALASGGCGERDAGGRAGGAGLEGEPAGARDGAGVVEREAGAVEPAPVTRLATPGPALGEELMLGLALARNLHHKADVYLAEGRVAEAAAAVSQILDLRFPAGAPEGEDVVLDARARLAKLLVTQGEIDRALEVVDDGLRGPRRASFFLANLHSVRGEVLEGRAILRAAAEPEAARLDRREAIVEFDRAMQIERALLAAVAPAGARP